MRDETEALKSAPLPASPSLLLLEPRPFLQLASAPPSPSSSVSALFSLAASLSLSLSISLSLVSAFDPALPCPALPCAPFNPYLVHFRAAHSLSARTAINPS